MRYCLKTSDNEMLAEVTFISVDSFVDFNVRIFIEVYTEKLIKLGRKNNDRFGDCEMGREAFDFYNDMIFLDELRSFWFDVEVENKKINTKNKEALMDFVSDVLKQISKKHNLIFEQC